MQEQYLKNVELLEQAVRTDAAIFPIAGHKKKDGTLDIERNLKIWRQALEPFYKTLLWEGGAPGFDASKTPLQEDPYLVFFSAPESETPKGTKAGGGAVKRGVGAGKPAGQRPGDQPVRDKSGIGGQRRAGGREFSPPARFRPDHFPDDHSQPGHEQIHGDGQVQR